MRIAITGGTGFLGRYIIRHLAGAGHQLRCWHRPTSDRSGLDKWSIEWLAGSLGDATATGALVRGVDAVVHSALEWPRQGGFRFSAQKDQERFLEANLMGSLRLFQEAFAADVPRFTCPTRSNQRLALGG